MDIKIKATNLNLTEAIQNYVDKRISGLEKLIDENDTSVQCFVEVEETTESKTADNYRAEVNLHIAGHDFRSEARRDKLFDAIDEAKEQMARELRRNKKKRERNIRRGGAIIKDLLRRE